MGFEPDGKGKKDGVITRMDGKRNGKADARRRLVKR